MSNTTTEVGLHGKRVDHISLAAGDYISPDEYADQGDTRVIKDIAFAYTITEPAPDGSDVIVSTEVRRDEVVTVEQIGLIALRKGERNRSFYTTAELDRLRSTGSPAAPVTAAFDSAWGEYELSQWLETENPETGRAWVINDILERVGDDKDLANRMLQAENIRTNGDPRDGLVKGLTSIIQE
jgi:hypothetical protein